MGPLIPCSRLLVTSPWGFKARVGSLIQTWQRCTCYMLPETHLLCNTVKLFVASMAAEPFSSTYLRAGIGGARTGDLSCCSQKLYRLNCAGLAQTVKLSLPNIFLFQIWQEQELLEMREDPGGGEKEWPSSSYGLPGTIV